MKLISLLLALLLSGYAHTGPIADGTTTIAGLAAGAQEANPLIAVGPNVMAPLSIAARLGLMRYARGTDNCVKSAGAIDSFGWGAAVNNIAVMAGAGPAAIPLGLIATVLIYEKRRDHFVDYCQGSCSMSDVPYFVTEARCDHGRIVVLSEH